jgi:hypothetical protein
MAVVALLRVVDVGFAEKQPVWLYDATLHENIPQGCQLIHKPCIIECVNSINVTKSVLTF